MNKLKDKKFPLRKVNTGHYILIDTKVHRLCVNKKSFYLKFIHSMKWVHILKLGAHYHIGSTLSGTIKKSEGEVNEILQAGGVHQRLSSIKGNFPF